MKRHVRAVVAALAAAIAVGGAVAQAQTADVQIGFAFQAGGKTLPAGKYNVSVSVNGQVVVRGSGGQVTMLAITRLGRLNGSANPELVFDRVGDTVTLSEIWMPGEDGFLLAGTKEMHTHALVKGTGGKK